MTRLILLPTRTTDGRIVLRGVTVTPLQRLALWLDRRRAPLR